MAKQKNAPRGCPVCGEILALTRLSCDECGTEISGHFPTCEYCSLSAEDRETLRVFLASRGNMREVEKHLAVSYPTARARFDALLARLGHEPADSPEEQAPDGSSVPDNLGLLEAVARGEVDVDEALRRMA